MKKTLRIISASLLSLLPLVSSCSQDVEDTAYNRFLWYMKGYIADTNNDFGYLSHDLYGKYTKLETEVVESEIRTYLYDEGGEQVLTSVSKTPVHSLYVVNDENCYSEVTSSSILYYEKDAYLYHETTKSYTSTEEISDYVDYESGYEVLTVGEGDEALVGEEVPQDETYTRNIYSGYLTYDAFLAGDESLFTSLKSACTDEFEALYDDLFEYNEYSTVTDGVEYGAGYIDFCCTRSYFEYSTEIIEGHIDTYTGNMTWTYSEELDYDYYYSLNDSRARHVYTVSKGSISFSDEPFEIDFTTEGKDYTTVTN